MVKNGISAVQNFSKTTTKKADVFWSDLTLFCIDRYQLQFQEPVPVEQLIKPMCDVKQAFTQFGGKRPFGVSILYMGWDKHLGYQLYQSDPSGNYGGWKATCIGNNSQRYTLKNTGKVVWNVGKMLKYSGMLENSS